jgi:hypothetical protein
MTRLLSSVAVRTSALLFVLVGGLAPQASAQSKPAPKLDQELSTRASQRQAWRRSRIVVQLESGQMLPQALRAYQRGNRLNLINGYVLEVPDAAIAQVAAHASVKSAHFDRPIWAADYLSTHATGADVVQDTLGLSGRGIGVAVIY